MIRMVRDILQDVKTAQGWVLEFQYSFLKPEERRARNVFYEKLIWVVNGTRRVRDKTQFFKLLNESNPLTTNPHVRKIYLDECALLKEWSGIHAPILFDFEEEILWCLLPVNQNMWGYIVAFPRREFIELNNRNAEHKKNFEECLNNLNTLANLIAQRLIEANGTECSTSCLRTEAELPTTFLDLRDLKIRFMG